MNLLSRGGDMKERTAWNVYEVSNANEVSKQTHPIKSFWASNSASAFQGDIIAECWADARFGQLNYKEGITEPSGFALETKAN